HAKAYSVNPDDGSTIDTLDFGNFGFVQATQADSLWLNHSYADAWRYTAAGTELDRGDLVSDFNTYADCLAYDAQGKVLYVVGRKYAADDSYTYELLRFDAESELDVLLSEIPFSYTAATSFDAGTLWIQLYDGQVAQVDPLTGKVQRSFDSPDRTLNWNG